MNELKPPIMHTKKPDPKKTEQDKTRKTRYSFDNKNVELITNCIITSSLVIGGLLIVWQLIAILLGKCSPT